MSLERDRVKRLFTSGVEAIESVGAGFTDENWHEPACGEWTVSDVARHVLAVSRWYHEWLDRGIDGESGPPFPVDELAPRNASALAALTHVTGRDALGEYGDSARAYLDRVSGNWDVPYGFPYGTVTAGLHLGVAATEWHIHAWDLHQASGLPYEPSDPEGVFLATGQCFARAEGGVKGTAIRLVAPLAARRHPWATVLDRSGRSAART